MSTRGSIYYKHPIHIYEEMNDGWVYLTLEDSTPDVLITLCRAELYFKIKRWLTKRAPDAAIAATIRKSGKFNLILASLLARKSPRG